MRALVTGAAGGLGGGVARRLAADGHGLGVVDRDPSVVALAHALAETHGVPAVGIRADVGDEESVVGAVAAVAEHLGGLDLAVNAAAVGGPGDAVVDTDLGALRRTLDVNLIGSWLVARAAARIMLDQGGGGCIVNFGSLFGQQGSPHGLAYCLSKGGVTLLTQVLAIELGPAAIRVNTVAPGYMTTEMHLDEVRGRAARSGRTLEEELAAIRAVVPLGRHGTAEDAAGVVAWLASPDAAYVTGQTISVNGGVWLT